MKSIVLPSKIFLVAALIWTLASFTVSLEERNKYILLALIHLCAAIFFMWNNIQRLKK